MSQDDYRKIGVYMSKTDTEPKASVLYDKKMLILFILVTAYFIFQHQASLSWDFSSYVENAKYLFSGGTYFEPLRPPLMPFILGILSIFGFSMAEYLYIILISALFMHSSAKLAEALRFDKVAFYAVSLNAYILISGLYNGTELLSVALLELSIAAVIKKEAISGFYLGLSALARYTGLGLFPVLLLLGNPKKIVKSMILFSIPIGIWFLYNYIRFGNLFTSIADQYANNILYRDYLIQPANPLHFLAVLNIFVPFFIIGLALGIYSLAQYIYKGRENIRSCLKSAFDNRKAEILMLAILIFSVMSYMNIPMKDPRYLFTLTVPAIYYSYLGIRYAAKKIGKKTAALAIVMFLMTFSLVLTAEITRMDGKPLIKELYYDTPYIYLDAIGTLKNAGIEDCSLMSNAWVLMNYLGQPSEPSTRREFVEEDIENGKIMLFFFTIGEPDYVRDKQFIESLPIIYQDNSYIILGKKDICLPQEVVDTSYLEDLKRIVYRRDNMTINTNPCIILFGNTPLLEKSCNLVNLNGFRQDENRWTGA